MYAISFLFLLVAAATLFIGWLFQEGLTLIWVSIGASVAAAIFLIVGVFRRRSLEPATAGAPFGPEEGTEAAQAGTVTEPRDTRPRAPIPQRRPAGKRPAGKPATERAPSAAAARPEAKKPAAKKPTAKKPSTKKAAAKKPSAKKAAAKKPSAKKASAKKPSAKKAAAKKTSAKKTSAKAAGSRSQVISIPERGTFHEAGCRFVKGRRDTEKITVSAAKQRGYTACGVCKPAA